jgi:GT2 family glycosyltransferase
MNIHKPWAPETITEFSAQKPGKPPKDLVSICVTNFNYACFLPDCLNSLAAQTHKNLELVIVDDKSTKDNSIEVAKKWLKANASRFHRAVLLSHCRNQGPSEARNTAFRNATGTYVFVIDADNEAYPRAIARLYAALIDGDFDAAYPQLEVFGDRKAIGSADIWDPEEIAQNNYVDVMCVIRKAAWEAVDGFSHIDEGWEDYDFWLKFIDADFCAGYVPEILGRYRVHGQSRTVTEAFVAHEQLKLIMAFRHPPKPSGQASSQASGQASERQAVKEVAKISPRPANTDLPKDSGAKDSGPKENGMIRKPPTPVPASPAPSAPAPSAPVPSAPVGKKRPVRGNGRAPHSIES